MGLAGDQPLVLLLHLLNLPVTFLLDLLNFLRKPVLEGQLQVRLRLLQFLIFNFQLLERIHQQLAATVLLREMLQRLLQMLDLPVQKLHLRLVLLYLKLVLVLQAALGVGQLQLQQPVLLYQLVSIKLRGVPIQVRRSDSEFEDFLRPSESLDVLLDRGEIRRLLRPFLRAERALALEHRKIELLYFFAESLLDFFELVVQLLCLLDQRLLF